MAAPPAIVCAGTLLALPLGLSGCGVPSGPELDRRIVEALRSLAPGFGRLGRLAASAGMTEAQALAKLRADASELHLYALTFNRFLLRSFVAERVEGDLRDGHTRYVAGWLLAETEVAIAVLLGT